MKNYLFTIWTITTIAIVAIPENSPDWLSFAVGGNLGLWAKYLANKLKI